MLSAKNHLCQGKPTRKNSCQTEASGPTHMGLDLHIILEIFYGLTLWPNRTKSDVGPTGHHLAAGMATRGADG